MRECLYHPQFGYYSKPEARRFADFYTSVDVHPIFGRLLARQLAEMWDVLGRPREFHAVEAGAGRAVWPAQILDFAARELPNFMVRCATSPSSNPRRGANGTAKHLRSSP